MQKDSSGAAEEQNWAWQWARIPLEFIGGFILSFLLMVGGGLASSRAADIFGYIFLGLLFLLVLRAIYNLYRLWRKKAPYFWLTSLGFFTIFIGACLLPILLIRPAMNRINGRARQTEAKIALAAIYGNETAYFAEYKKYTADVKATGAVREEGYKYYRVGFPDACAIKLGIPVEKAQWPASNPSFADREGELRAAFQKITDCPDSAQGFTAYAIGVIRKDGPLDIWKITEKKVLENIESGL